MASLAEIIPLDNLKEILSFNDQVLTKDNRIIGKIDKNSQIYNLLLQKPLIKDSLGMYAYNGVTHIVQFPTGDQILFGRLNLDNDILIDFRIRGIKYSRHHNPYRSYKYLIK
uniref:Uncharacterized protein n=1 Tax=viral metagenome TaxID=1070528 RepID=A0A6C0I910_9ZZZZ